MFGRNTSFLFLKFHSVTVSSPPPSGQEQDRSNRWEGPVFSQWPTSWKLQQRGLSTAARPHSWFHPDSRTHHGQTENSPCGSQRSTPTPDKQVIIIIIIFRTTLIVPPVGCHSPHPLSPFIITQSEGRYSFYRPTEGRRLSRPSWLVTYLDGLPTRRWSPIK